MLKSVLTKIAPALPIATILLLITIVYIPSLDHLPRSDHDVFLSEIADIESLPELISYTYSYPRTRLFAPGDQLLFRPLTFLFLSLEKWIFGYNFVLWQIAGLLLHLGVVYQFIRLGHLFDKTLRPVLFGLLFGVAYISCEMVIWQHIHAYIIFFLILLMTIRQFLTDVIEPSKEQRFLPVIILITLANFFYEYGILCNFIFILTYMIVANADSILKKVLNSLKLAIPTILYFSCSFLDALIHHVSSNVSTESINWLKAMGGAFSMMMINVVSLIFPSGIHLVTDYRLILQWPPTFNGLSPAQIVNIFFGIGIILWIFTTIKISFSKCIKSKSEYALIVLTVAMALVYVAMIVAGRFSERGVEYLFSNLYYFYPITLFGLILALLFSTYHKGYRYAICTNILLLGLIILNATNVVKIGGAYESFYKDIREDYNRLGVENYFTSNKWVRLGWVYEKERQYNQALDSFNRALAIDPTLAQAYNGRGKVYFMKGQSKLALENFNRAIKIDDGLSDAFNNRGNLYKRIGRLDLAIGDYNKYVTLEPILEAGYNNRGVIYLAFKKYSLALKDFKKAHALNPASASVLFNQAMVYQQLENYQKAIEVYDLAIKADPQYIQAYNNKAMSNMSLGQNEKALADLNSAIDINPNVNLLYQNRAKVHYRLGNEQKAQEDLQKVTGK